MNVSEHNLGGLCPLLRGPPTHWEAPLNTLISSNTAQARISSPQWSSIFLGTWGLLGKVSQGSSMFPA